MLHKWCNIDIHTYFIFFKKKSTKSSQEVKFPLKLLIISMDDTYEDGVYDPQIRR